MIIEECKAGCSVIEPMPGEGDASQSVGHSKGGPGDFPRDGCVKMFCGSA